MHILWGDVINTGVEIVNSVIMAVLLVLAEVWYVTIACSCNVGSG